jgi:hypothetical protein
MKGSVGLSGYVLDLAAKGTYYLNCKTEQASISGDCFQGERGEDEDKGGVRVFVIVILVRDLNLLILRMLNVCCLYTPDSYRHSPQITPLIEVDVMICLYDEI